MCTFYLHHGNEWATEKTVSKPHTHRLKRCKNNGKWMANCVRWQNHIRHSFLILSICQCYAMLTLCYLLWWNSPGSGRHSHLWDLNMCFSFRIVTSFDSWIYTIHTRFLFRNSWTLSFESFSWRHTECNLFIIHSNFVDCTNWQRTACLTHLPRFLFLLSLRNRNHLRELSLCFFIFHLYRREQYDSHGKWRWKVNILE